ncbi:MAG: twin-arginine translocation signal domain-containing protein, partial [Chloroflexi bacterium]
MSEISSLTRALTEGRITRRTFIGQAAVLGLSMSAIMALLEACTTSPSG